jgi:hypothetical protein
MTQLSNIFGKGDGVSATTKAGFVKSGLNADGSYGDAPPPPPPPPPESSQQGSQVGRIELENERKLKEMLKKRGNLSDEEADRKVREHKKSHGYR